MDGKKLHFYTDQTQSVEGDYGVPFESTKKAIKWTMW